ncbi:hypothetical protein HII13_003553 [Brettanomyces bruxellensis]|nr:hypothetical protein HII13_003553 [Brettanomyces bruxellensis]
MMASVDIDYRKRFHDNPLSEVSATSFVLGGIFGFSAAISLTQQYKPIYLYAASVSLFHFLEYFMTSKFQPTKVTSDSFLLNNGLEYLLAHTLALLETFIELYFFPNFKKSGHYVKIIGLCLVIFGQILRTLAMATSGENFSHIIEHSKKSSHVLVTSGIYGYFRHPSYVGFFYWAVGTQMLLLNPVISMLFIVLLYKFFSGRIKYEESTLVTFFGPKYIAYRKKVPVGIPFL